VLFSVLRQKLTAIPPTNEAVGPTPENVMLRSVIFRLHVPMHSRNLRYFFLGFLVSFTF
jgi:hypothetical protein